MSSNGAVLIRNLVKVGQLVKNTKWDVIHTNSMTISIYLLLSSLGKKVV
jgi:hypothetical protein